MVIKGINNEKLTIKNRRAETEDRDRDRDR
jgi:hypothetical protein